MPGLEELFPPDSRVDAIVIAYFDPFQRTHIKFYAGAFRGVCSKTQNKY